MRVWQTASERRRHPIGGSSNLKVRTPLSHLELRSTALKRPPTLAQWRRERDCSRLGPLVPRYSLGTARAKTRVRPSPPLGRRLVEPKGSNPLSYLELRSTGLKRPPTSAQWRRERDSNPRWAFDPYALSRGAPSTTRPSLRSRWNAGGHDSGGGRVDQNSGLLPLSLFNWLMHFRNAKFDACQKLICS